MDRLNRTPVGGAGPAAGAGGGDDFPGMARYQRGYRDVPYYSAGRTWSDYAPAYRYGHRQCAAHAGATFEQTESALERDWQAIRGASRLSWTEARPAVMAAWRDAAALAEGFAIDDIPLGAG